jgi:hypothetical protein
MCGKSSPGYGPREGTKLRQDDAHTRRNFVSLSALVRQNLGHESKLRQCFDSVGILPTDIMAILLE